MEIDIISLIIDALAKHDRDAAIQEVCLNCLSTLIDEDELRDQILETRSDLIQITRKTMDRFSATANVQSSGCVLMRTFVDNSDLGQELFVEANGIETVLKAIENHSLVHYLNTVTAAAFGCLADVSAGKDEYAEMIARAGGIKHATKALAAYGT